MNSSRGLQIVTPLLNPITDAILIKDGQFYSGGNTMFKGDTPYIINLNPFNAQTIQNAFRNSPGTYTVKVTVTPTDLKCDFNGNTNLDYFGIGNTNNEYKSATIPNSISYTVFKDVDGDGWDDLRTSGKGKDLCLNEGTTSTTGSFNPTILDRFQGCKKEYTAN